MKKLLTSSVLTVLAATAFGQGKVNLINDAASLVTLDGVPVGNINPLPGGIVLMAGLYGGIVPGNLFLYSTYTMNSSAPGTAGVIGPLHIVLNALPNGAPPIPGIANNTPIIDSTPWFQVRVWDTRFPTFEAAFASGDPYVGEGARFQMNPGPSIAYINTSPSANSTWVDGPIEIPEPTVSMVLAVGTLMLMFRPRSKASKCEPNN